MDEFKKTKRGDIRHDGKLNHHTNLRPLWAIDNLKKGSKLPHEIAQAD